MEKEKKTKDLTEEEILQFRRSELEHWMNRVMARLFKLVERRQYDRLSARFVTLSQLGIEATKRGLIELVKVIKERWREPVLSVVK